MKNKLSTIILIVMSLILVACGQEETNNLLENPYQKTEIVMGTAVSIRVYDEGKEDMIEKAFTHLKELSDKADANLDSSEVGLINQNAGIKPVEVSEEIFTLIEVGKQYAEGTDGLFDISIGALTSLWNIGYDDARKPEQEEIDDVLKLIGYEKIELNEKEQTVFLQDEGMRIDLGGIAKGYFADFTAELFKENGVTSAVIDLGGNLYVLGNHPEGREWSVGIQDPDSDRGEVIGKIDTTNMSIVTSGVYERVLVVDGEKYHHILNPRDGYPFDNEVAGVSIISEKSIDGDSLSTASFAMGLVAGMKYIESLENVEAAFITHDKEVYLSSGLEDEIEILNDEYKVALLQDRKEQ